MTNVRFLSHDSHVISVGGADQSIFQWQFLPPDKLQGDTEASTKTTLLMSSACKYRVNQVTLSTFISFQTLLFLSPLPLPPSPFLSLSLPHPSSPLSLPHPSSPLSLPHPPSPLPHPPSPSPPSPSPPSILPLPLSSLSLFTPSPSSLPLPLHSLSLSSLPPFPLGSLSIKGLHRIQMIVIVMHQMYKA